MTKQLYFAHPMSSYNTDAEAHAMALLARHLEPKYQIVNPNKPCFQRKADAIRRENREQPLLSRQQNPFSVFEALVSHADAIAYLPFPDGKIGFGIVGEIESFKQVHPNGTIYEIDRAAGKVTEVTRLDRSRCHKTSMETRSANKRADWNADPGQAASLRSARRA